MNNAKDQNQGFCSFETWREERKGFGLPVYQKWREASKRKGETRSRSPFPLALSEFERYMLEFVAHHRKMSLSETIRSLIYEEYCRIVGEGRGENFNDEV